MGTCLPAGRGGGADSSCWAELAKNLTGDRSHDGDDRLVSDDDDDDDHDYPIRMESLHYNNDDDGEDDEDDGDGEDDEDNPSNGVCRMVAEARTDRWPSVAAPGHPNNRRDDPHPCDHHDHFHHHHCYDS